MDAKSKKSIETRRLYKFEEIFLNSGLAEYANEPRDTKFLRAFAKKIWAKHGRKNLPMPRIRINRRSSYSWCSGFSEIELAIAANTRTGAPHNTIEVLIHELVHAIGYRTHGKSFVKKYVELLVEYAGLNEGELRIGLGLFNIKS